MNGRFANAYIKDETIWVTKKQWQNCLVSKYLQLVSISKIFFANGALDEDVVISKMEITPQHGAIEGKIQISETNFYNLDAIISVGYRVNSKKASQFRIWETKLLKEYMKKGFVLNDERLKQGCAAFGKDYFRELLERVRSIMRSQIIQQQRLCISLLSIKKNIWG